MKKKKTIKIKNVVLEIPVAVMLIILTLLVLVPVIWMVFSAFKPEKEIISWPPTFIPNSFTLENFTDVQNRIDILSIYFELCYLCGRNDSTCGCCKLYGWICVCIL